MRKAAITVFWLLSVVPSAMALQVDLHEAQRLALEANLGLQAQVLEAAGAGEAVSGGYGVYDPRLEVEAAAGSIREKVNFSFISENPVEETDYREGRLSLLQKLPTGADFSILYSVLREGSNNTTRLFDPSYANEWEVALVQPLLRGVGRTVTEQNLLFAVKDNQATFHQLRQQAFFVLADVRRTYFEVLRLRNELRYREASVEVAARLLEENRARVRAGVLPSVEILQAEVGLQLRERERLDAGRFYEDALDRMRSLLDHFGPLEVTGTLAQPDLDADEERGFALAIQKRPDLAGLRTRVSRLRLEQDLAANRALPALDVSARYGHAGLDREYGDSLDELAENDLWRWEVGLVLSYPLGNREARHDYNRAKILRQAGITRTLQQQNEVRREIREAIRALEVSAKKIEVGRLATELGEEELRTLFKRREVGLATTREVLEGEEDLAEAKSLFSEALAEYNTAVTEYYRATGQLLEKEGIVFRQSDRNDHIIPVYE